jgi:hypothetical protein
MLCPHVVPPIDEGVIFAVIEIFDPIADSSCAFDASRDNLLAHFITQNLLPQIRHNRSVQNWPITDDWTASRNWTASQNWCAAHKWWHNAARSAGACFGARRQLTGNGTICSIQEIIQPITIHGLAWLHNPRQRGSWNRRPTP